jgi:hypothetical protein
MLAGATSVKPAPHCIRIGSARGIHTVYELASMLADRLRTKDANSASLLNAISITHAGARAAASFLGTSPAAEPLGAGPWHGFSLQPPSATRTLVTRVRRRRSLPPASMQGGAARQTGTFHSSGTGSSRASKLISLSLFASLGVAFTCCAGQLLRRRPAPPPLASCSLPPVGGPTCRPPAGNRVLMLITEKHKNPMHTSTDAGPKKAPAPRHPPTCTPAAMCAGSPTGPCGRQ